MTPVHFLQTVQMQHKSIEHMELVTAPYPVPIFQFELPTWRRRLFLFNYP